MLLLPPHATSERAVKGERPAAPCRPRARPGGARGRRAGPPGGRPRWARGWVALGGGRARRW